jgi:ribosome-binding protein aMBF1 (putative translation factor)
MDPMRISKRTLDELDKMPPEKRARVEAIIAKTQMPEARAKSASNRDILDREYRETGRIATIGEKVNAEDAVAFSRLLKTLRDERLARGLSLEDVSQRLNIDKGALSRLEGGQPSNPTIATLLRYARALDMRLNLSLEHLQGTSTSHFHGGPASPVEGR